MRGKIYLIILALFLISIAFFFRYEYTADKQARVDRFTQNYEINCFKKNAYLSIDECSKLTPEEIFIREQERQKQEAKDIEQKKEQVEKDLESQRKCKESLAKARLDYSSEKMANPSGRMLDWHSFIIKEYEKMCS